jgi:hypothetical protein
MLEFLSAICIIRNGYGAKREMVTADNYHPVRFHVHDFHSGSLPQRRQHSPPAEKSDLMLRNQRFLEVNGSQ